MLKKMEEDYLEEKFGSSYEDADRMSDYFGITKTEAILIMLIKELRELNSNQSNIDYDLREGLKK